MPAIGTPKFDGISILELTANFAKPGLEMTAKAAYVDTKTGNTHGWTSGRQWSPATIELLGRLRQSMEEDLGARDFLDEQHSSGGRSPAQGPGGLAEHLRGTPDAPQT